MFKRFFQNFALRFSGLDDNQRQLLKKHLRIWEDGFDTQSGVNVTQESGLRQDTVYRCVTLTAATVAQTPLPVYQRLERGRMKRRDHPVYRVLNEKANKDMTSFTWKQVTMGHVLGWGNAFSEIERNRRGDIIGLNPMNPADVSIPGRDAQGNLVYEWRDKDNKPFLFRARDILHLRGHSWDGIVGISPILQLKELIGRTKAREEFQSRFYSNGANLGGAITTPEELTDEQLERHRKSFQETYAGNKNAHKVLLLEGAEKYVPFGINPKDAEFVLTAKLDRASIAAVFGVPLQLINDLENGASRASAEQLFRDWLAVGLQQWFVNLEQQMAVSLLSQPEREQGFFIEFLREALIQPDTEKLITSLTEEVQKTLLTPNEGREKLNLNPVEGGDTLLAPVNMLPIDKLGEAQVSEQRDEKGNVTKVEFIPQPLALPPAETRTDNEPRHERGSRLARRRAKKAARGLLLDAFERIGKRERQDVRKQARKTLQRDVTDFTKFLNEYYAEDSNFAEFIRRTLTPIAASLSEQIREEIRDELEKDLDGDGKQFVREYVSTLALRYTSSSRRQLQKVLDNVTGKDEPFEAIEQRLDEWESGTSEENPPRVEKEAQREANRMANAISRGAYLAAGLLTLVWRTVGKNCPLCNELDGKVVGIRQGFLSKGDRVEGEGTAPLTTPTDVFHPPLHDGCDCEVVPE